MFLYLFPIMLVYKLIKYVVRLVFRAIFKCIGSMRSGSKVFTPTNAIEKALQDREPSLNPLGFIELLSTRNLYGLALKLPNGEIEVFNGKYKAGAGTESRAMDFTSQEAMDFALSKGGSKRRGYIKLPWLDLIDLLIKLKLGMDLIPLSGSNLVFSLRQLSNILAHASHPELPPLDAEVFQVATALKPSRPKPEEIPFRILSQLILLLKRHPEVSDIHLGFAENCETHERFGIVFIPAEGKEKLIAREAIQLINESGGPLLKILPFKVMEKSEQGSGNELQLLIRITKERADLAPEETKALKSAALHCPELEISLGAGFECSPGQRSHELSNEEPMAL